MSMPPEHSTPHQGPRVYSVSELNSEVRLLLEDHYPEVWLEGELSNFARPRSGHMYFTLKDERAQLRSAMFRGDNRLLEFTPENGLQVLVRGRLSLYRERGEYQLIVDYMEPAGAGALRRRFEQLRRKLSEEGLFDPIGKRDLPSFPHKIGVITSATGAAVRDVLKVLHRRFAGLPVIVYPTRVQGEGSAAEIAQTIEIAAARAECDVLLLVRGGGSLEDLWAFNEEVVARAIHASNIPVVSGIGHETDVTIADFVADVRAPTPSVAAEMASPDGIELSQSLHRIAERLSRRAYGQLVQERRALEQTFKRLRHPRQHLDMLAQRNDDALIRLTRGVEGRFPRERTQLRALDARLTASGPRPRIDALHHRLSGWAETLGTHTRHRIEHRRTRLNGLLRALESVSPERTLERGYAIVRTEPEGAVLRAAVDTNPGAQVKARLAFGEIVCEVIAVQDESSEP